jgi:hypothetical protein
MKYRFQSFAFNAACTNRYGEEGDAFYIVEEGEAAARMCFGAAAGAAGADAASKDGDNNESDAKKQKQQDVQEVKRYGGAVRTS